MVIDERACKKCGDRRKTSNGIDVFCYTCGYRFDHGFWKTLFNIFKALRTIPQQHTREKEVVYIYENTVEEPEEEPENKYEEYYNHLITHF
jgi:hypothetical protein